MTTQIKKRTYPYYKGQYYDKVNMAWIDVQKSFTTVTKAKDYMFKQRSFGAFKDYDCGVRVMVISKTDRWAYTGHCRKCGAVLGPDAPTSSFVCSACK